MNKACSGIWLLSVAGAISPVTAFAVTANNVFVTVSSSTAGVEGIFPVGGDFYVTTRGVTNPPFRADIGISANSPYYLVKTSSGRMNLTVGENEEYRVCDESGAEDSFTGRVYVVKIEIEPKETNVCWKASSCKLKLTDDSVPGGAAVWTSSPGGISGSGNSITFNPSALSAGEYTVTARSGIVPSYTDTCIVRVVKVAGLERQIGAAVEWRCFDKPQKILYRKDSRVRAIAGVYGHDLHRFAFDAIRYARKALTNDLDIIEECKQHLIVACAQDVLVRDGKIDAIGAKKARGVCLIHGLSFVLDHLSNDKCVPLTSVGKFEADASDPRHGELVRRHAERMKARNHIRLQNQLIYYRDEFCVRLIELYGVKLLQETEFKMLVDEIRATSEKKREIIMCMSNQKFYK